MEKRSTRSTINTSTLPFTDQEEEKKKKKKIKRHARCRLVEVYDEEVRARRRIYLAPYCLKIDTGNEKIDTAYSYLLREAFDHPSEVGVREAYTIFKNWHLIKIEDKKSTCADNETQTSTNTTDQESNTHIVWKIPPTTKVNATQTSTEKINTKVAFSQTPTPASEEKKTQTQRTTSEEKKTQTETKKKKEKPHKAANTQTTNIETKEKKIQTTNVHMNEPQQSNEFDNLLDQVSRELEAVPLSPIPATPPRPPTTATTTTASTSECQPTPPIPTTTKQGERKKRRRPPPHIRRQQQCPRQQPQQHRGQQQQQQGQYQEQHYPSWGYFNHPMADLIQLLLDHLYWPPAPTFRHPNGQPRQQQQQRRRQRPHASIPTDTGDSHSNNNDATSEETGKSNNPGTCTHWI